MKVHCLYDRLVPLNELKSHPKNRNVHPSHQVKRLAKILEYQGFRYPVKVSKRSGFVTSGHGRIEAAKFNKWKEVPVNFQDYESDEQEYADVQADNAIASWAELDLSAINMDLGDLGPDFDIDMLGLEDFVIEPADKYQGDEDEVPEVRKTSIELGQLWRLGSHYLLCGDATNPDHVDALMNRQKADMVFTDPPYGIDIVKNDGNVGGNRKLGKVGYGRKGQYDKRANCRIYSKIEGDDKPFDPSLLLTLSKKHIIWGANNFASKLPDNSHWLVWDKQMPEGTDFSSCELAWTSLPGRTVKTYKFTWAGMTRQGNRKDELINRVHPTQKPVGLFENILNDYESGSIADLYLGSGSTLIACEKTHRKCFGMEIEPHYCQVIIDRWEKFTGKKAAKMESYGKTRTQEMASK